MNGRRRGTREVSRKQAPDSALPNIETSRLTRNGTAEPVSRDQILRRERGRGTLFFRIQLTTYRIGNITRSIHTLAICVTTQLPRQQAIGKEILLFFKVRNNMLEVLLNRHNVLCAGRPGSSEVPRNLLTRWDVSSIPANGIFLTKKLKN